MAIYHFSAKVISRANGSSAVASAAYRSAERLHDDRLDRDHDFTNKSGVVHSEVMLPEARPNDLATVRHCGMRSKPPNCARTRSFPAKSNSLCA
jgi:hypothetical protein